MLASASGGTCWARVADGTISGKIAKQVFEIMLESGEGATIIESKGLKQGYRQRRN